MRRKREVLCPFKGKNVIEFSRILLDHSNGAYTEDLDVQEF